MSATVRQNYKQYDIYDELVEEHGIFENYRDMFVFCGCVGYHEGRIKERESEYAGEAEQLWMHFTNEPAYRAAAASIAYQYTGNPQALIEPEIQLEVLAKYAAGGAQLIASKFGGQEQSPREALLDYINSVDSKQKSETKDAMQAIIQEFDVASD